MSKLVFLLIWLMAFGLNWEELTYFGDWGSLVRFFGMGALAFAVIGVIARGKMRPWPPALKAFMACYAWTVLSYLWTQDPPATERYIFTRLALMTFVWLIWEYSPLLSLQSKLLFGYIFGNCVSLAMLYYAYYQGRSEMIYEQESRFTGGDLNANDLAILAIFAAVYALRLLVAPVQRKSYIKAFLWAFVPVATLGSFLTGSRAALGVATATVGGCLFMMRFLQRKVSSRFKLNPRFKILLDLAAVLTVALVIWLVPASTFDRFQKTTSSFQEESRYRLWSTAIALIPEYPLQGVGVGAFGKVGQSMGLPKKGPVHNVLLEVLVEEGIVGLTLYLLALYYVFREAWRNPSEGRIFWIAGFLAWLVFGIVAPMSYNKGTFFLFAMILVESAAQRVMQGDTAAAPARLAFVPRPRPSPGR